MSTVDVCYMKSFYKYKILCKDVPWKEFSAIASYDIVSSGYTFANSPKVLYIVDKRVYSQEDNEKVGISCPHTSQFWVI